MHFNVIPSHSFGEFNHFTQSPCKICSPSPKTQFKAVMFIVGAATLYRSLDVYKMDYCLSVLK